MVTRIAIALLTPALALACTAGRSPSNPPSSVPSVVAAPSAGPGTVLATAPSPRGSDTPQVSATPIPEPTQTSGGVQGGVPAFDHIYVIVMENHGYGSIVGSSDAPYINSLIASYGLATNYNAIAHPSEPNYIALFAGSTLGVNSDGRYDLTALNVADQIDAAGKTWHVYEQNYPGDCSPTSSASGPVDLVGLAGYYFRKHNPAISFTDISADPNRCAAITSLASFDPAAANFELVVPNTYNDMHSAPTSTGDAFLKDFVPLITESPAFANSLLVITWDEGGYGLSGGGHVTTLVISPLLSSAGMQSDVAHDHYSLLRTIEDGLGLPCLANTCQANDLSEFFN